MAVSGFCLRARLDFSIPSCPPGQRGITPAFGYSAPHSGTEGTPTPVTHALPSAHYAFPDIHWLKIRTNNPFERIMKEICRRTRVVGAFPDGQSCLNLAAARLRYIAGTAWSAKCYMNMRPLYQPQVMQTEAVA